MKLNCIKVKSYSMRQITISQVEKHSLANEDSSEQNTVTGRLALLQRDCLSEHKQAIGIARSLSMHSEFSQSTGPTGSWGCRSCSPGWRELCCSMGCCCPKLGSCWNCPHHRCHWPHQTAYSPAAWSAAHPRPRTPLPSEWAHLPPSRPAGDSKGCKHYPRNTGEGVQG